MLRSLVRISAIIALLAIKPSSAAVPPPALVLADDSNWRTAPAIVCCSGGDCRDCRVDSDPEMLAGEGGDPDGPYTDVDWHEFYPEGSFTPSDWRQYHHEMEVDPE